MTIMKEVKSANVVMLCVGIKVVIELFIAWFLITRRQSLIEKVVFVIGLSYML